MLEELPHFLIISIPKEKNMYWLPSNFQIAETPNELS